MPIYEYRCQTCATGKTVGLVHESFGPGSLCRSPDHYIDPDDIGAARSAIGRPPRRERA